MLPGFLSLTRGLGWSVILTVTLPAQPATGQTILVIDTSGQCSAANTITVTGGTLDGQTSKVLNTSYASLCCYYNGVNWSIVP